MLEMVSEGTEFIPQASSSFVWTSFFLNAGLAYAGRSLSISIELLRGMFPDSLLDNRRHPESLCGKVYSSHVSASHTNASSEHPHY